MKKKHQPRQKHVPARTCIACRAQRAKRDLVRVVRLTEGGVVVDEIGKQKGRGAYLCRQRACWTLALKRGALNHALRATLTVEEAAALQVYAATLPETLETSEAAVPGAENLTEEV
ncbi:MAG TPA: YlxR family protein [Anaerolineales bacterium]|nr:YlxR family protein [Anaerolineales bacterium]